MREILFRGKILSYESQWVEGFYNHIPCGRFSCDEHCIQTIDEDGRIGQLFDVYENTVGQYTGLTDKNGKKIFEGDILKESDVIYNGEIQINGHIFTAAMRKGCWCVLSPCYFDEWDFLCSNANRCEVIGNIHDNPELLEVE